MHLRIWYKKDAVVFAIQVYFQFTFLDSSSDRDAARQFQTNGQPADELAGVAIAAFGCQFLFDISVHVVPGSLF